MKRKASMFGAIVLLAMAALFYVRCTQAKGAGSEAAFSAAQTQKIGLQTTALQAFVRDSLINATGLSATVQQQRFVKARLAYKQLEWAVEYWMPLTARFLNGPPVDEVEVAESIVTPPEGFQVLEPLLFPVVDSSAQAEIKREWRRILAHLSKIGQYMEVTTWGRAQAAEAGKLQLYRILTLGITGFDAPEAKTGLWEAASSLEHLQTLASDLDFDNQALEDQLAQAIATLKASDTAAFMTFDRASFIRKQLNPLCKLWQAEMKKQKLVLPDAVGILNPDGDGSLFSIGAINTHAFVGTKDQAFSQAKAALGQQLFQAQWLSTTGNASCAGCHQPAKAFTDGQAKSAALGGGTVARNAPTLAYAALQHGQFWDMRQPDLEAQAGEVIANAQEMHGHLPTAVAHIEQDPALKQQFTAVFGARKVEPWMVQNALASFIRSLSPFNSRCDRWMRGEEVLSALETEGFNIFAGKGKCAGCHFLPLTNGMVPPQFRKMESEVLGIPNNALNRRLDADLGRGKLTKVASFQRAFKIPTLRNVARTAPYMHNGAYQTLEQVVDFYNRGGGAGLDLAIDNQSLSDAPLGLTAQEQKALIAFLKTLDDAN